MGKKGGLIGTVLGVASFFVPVLKPISLAFNAINAVANKNPLGLISAGIGFAGMSGGGWGGGGGLEWSGDPGGGSWGGGYGGGGWDGGGGLEWSGDPGGGPSFATTDGTSLGDGSWGGQSSDFGGGTIPGEGSGFTTDPIAHSIEGNISNVSRFDPNTGLFGPATSTAGDVYTNINTDIGLTSPEGGFGKDLYTNYTTTAPNTFNTLNASADAVFGPQSSMPSLEGGGLGGMFNAPPFDIPEQVTSGGLESSSGPTSNLDAMGESVWGPSDTMPNVSPEVPQGSPGSEGSSFKDIFGGKLGKLMTPQNLFKVGGGLYGMMNERSQLKDFKKMAERSAAMADPFASQRPQYQQLLSQSYTPEGLNSLFNKEYMQGAGAQLMAQMAARDAARGRRSQYGARMADLHRQFMGDYLPKYRQGLGNPSGANFGPGGAGQAYALGMYPAIANRGRNAAGLMGTLSDIFR